MTNEILTQERLKELLHYNPNTGVFRWLVNSRNKQICCGDVAGSIHQTGYVRFNVLGKKRLAHRLAWLYVNGSFPDHQIDHINGIKHDNAIKNLREATNAQNSQNLKKARNDNSIGVLGVTFNKKNKNFVSKIKKDGKTFNLGSFSSIEKASEAYLAKKRELHKFSTI